MGFRNKHYRKYSSFRGHVGKIAPNILKQHFNETKPYQVLHTNVTALIENNLYNILLHAKNNKKIKNQNTYIYKALLKMFIDSYGNVDSESIKSKTIHRTRTPRIEKRPAWLQPDYYAPEISNEELAKYEANIACLMKKLELR